MFKIVNAIKVVYSPHVRPNGPAPITVQISHPDQDELTPITPGQYQTPEFEGQFIGDGQWIELQSRGWNGRTHFCTTNLGIRYIQFLTHETSIIRKLFIF